jgi:hypothetical protein
MSSLEVASKKSDMSLSQEEKSKASYTGGE